jgi:hypothetical protein
MEKLRTCAGGAVCSFALIMENSADFQRYDPPIALAPRRAPATVTRPSNSHMPKATPCSTPHHGDPTATWSLITSNEADPKATNHGNPLDTVIGSALAGKQNESKMTSNGDPVEVSITADPSELVDATNRLDGSSKTNQDPDSRNGLRIDASCTNVANSVTPIESVENPSLQNGGSTLTDQYPGQSEYVVNGRTFAPGLPITLTGDNGPVTFQLLTSASSTFVALGTTTTIPLIPETSLLEHSRSRVRRMATLSWMALPSNQADQSRLEKAPKERPLSIF